MFSLKYLSCFISHFFKNIGHSCRTNFLIFYNFYIFYILLWTDFYNTSLYVNSITIIYSNIMYTVGHIWILSIYSLSLLPCFSIPVKTKKNPNKQQSQTSTKFVHWCVISTKVEFFIFFWKVWQVWKQLNYVKTFNLFEEFL